MHGNRSTFPLWCLTSFLAALLTGCGGSGTSIETSFPPPPSHQFTHVYVVFPPATDPNKTHFMNTVMNQKAVDGVTVATSWIAAETGTPGPGTCGPVGTDVCQQAPVLEPVGASMAACWHVDQPLPSLGGAR